MLEAARQLDVAADRFARIIDPEADERDLKTVAEEARRVQDDTLLTIGTFENVVHLVDHEHLHADGLHDPQRRLLHLSDICTRPLRRAEQGEQFGVEPSFARTTGHFHRQDRRLQSSGHRVEARRVLVPKRFMIIVLPMPLSP